MTEICCCSQQDLLQAGFLEEAVTQMQCVWVSGNLTSLVGSIRLLPSSLPPPGWWFDACGLSNLNGIYYPARHHVRKLNGIRWHYFQGPSYSLRATRMMVRPIGT